MASAVVGSSIFAPFFALGGRSDEGRGYFSRKVGLFLKGIHKTEFHPFAAPVEGGDEASIFRVARDEKALRKKLVAQK